MKHRIKLIACDMDGTLLQDDKHISEENRKAVARLKEAGIQFVIATGRHDSMVKTYLDELEIETPVISCNGGMVRDPFSNELYSATPLTLEQVQTIVTICRHHKADYHIFARDLIYGETMTNRLVYYDERNKSLPLRDQVSIIVNPDYQTFLNQHQHYLMKILMIPEDPDSGTAMRDAILTETGLNSYHSGYGLYDVMQRGINKAHALKALGESLNLKRENIAAIGDQANDLEMIEYAGLGIAMENAIPELKEKARWVVKNDNNNSGVAEAINRLIS